jgi:opacity protein-like surface antigen
VTGVEADIQGSGIKASANAAPTSPFKDLISFEQKLSWFGTVRGRLGVTVTPDLLLYGTGGLAYGRVEASANSRLLIGEVISAEAEDIFGVVRKCQQEQSRLDRGRRRRMDVRA